MPECTPGTARAAFNVQENENASEFKLQTFSCAQGPEIFVLKSWVQRVPVSGCNLLWNSQMDTVCLQPLWPVIYVQTLWAVNFGLNSALTLTVLFTGRAGVGRNQHSSWVKKPDFMTDLNTRQKLCSVCIFSPRALALEMCYRDGCQACVPAVLHKPRYSRDTARVIDDQGWCCVCRVINCYILLSPSETGRKDPTTPKSIWMMILAGRWSLCVGAKSRNRC